MKDQKIKLCKNKECNKPLPEGYKHSYCESCRNKQAQKIKNVVKKTGGTALSLALLVVSAGKIKK